MALLTSFKQLSKHKIIRRVFFPLLSGKWDTYRTLWIDVSNKVTHLVQVTEQTQDNTDSVFHFYLHRVNYTDLYDLYRPQDTQTIEDVNPIRATQETSGCQVASFQKCWRMASEA